MASIETPALKVRVRVDHGNWSPSENHTYKDLKRGDKDATIWIYDAALHTSLRLEFEQSHPDTPITPILVVEKISSNLPRGGAEETLYSLLAGDNPNQEGNSRRYSKIIKDIGLHQLFDEPEFVIRRDTITNRMMQTIIEFVRADEQGNPKSDLLLGPNGLSTQNFLAFVNARRGTKFKIFDDITMDRGSVNFRVRNTSETRRSHIREAGVRRGLNYEGGACYAKYPPADVEYCNSKKTPDDCMNGDAGDDHRGERCSWGSK
jgi:hypothetical protein